MEEGTRNVDVVTASKEAPAPQAALGPELSSNFGSNSQTLDTHSVDNATADEPEVDVSAADGAGTDKDRSSGDVSSLQNVTAEAVSPKRPSPVKEGNDISPVQTKSLSRPLAQEESGWSLNSIRKRFQTVHGYFDSLVELAGGQNGVCQYRCRYGKSHSWISVRVLAEKDVKKKKQIGFFFFACFSTFSGWSSQSVSCQFINYWFQDNVFIV